MIETVVSANMLIGEVMRVKKNHLAPDFPTGDEKRLCIVSGIHGDEVAGQYICYELIRRIKQDFDKLTGIVDVYPFINPVGLEAQYRDVPVFDIDTQKQFFCSLSISAFSWSLFRGKLRLWIMYILAFCKSFKLFALLISSTASLKRVIAFPVLYFHS